MSLIGVISDTHGLLRPEIKEIFAECDLIIHAGDVGKDSVLNELEEITKVIAVKGNIDSGELANKLKETVRIRVMNTDILIIHDISKLDSKVLSAGKNVIIYGHSHKAAIKELGNTLYFNPGSAGPRRFRLPITIGLLRISEDNIEPSIKELNI
ncbi:MAG: metallophosphoesterase family protein [Bacteroidota bacterium]|nr:metallophosphoesterase family protein [Bacteroidota bacterium]MDP4191126.1 metallophosphoesterase family protein [Bacteroidota bacterium]MDP4193468.1 metallophosphoesterase family protein [Bacteroidota bacterium]